MAICKLCNKFVDDSELSEDGVCEVCRGLKNIEPTIKISSAVGYLKFSSWLILLLSLVGGVFVLFSMSYIETIDYVAGIPIRKSEFNILGIIYGIAILFQGIFLSSLGFSIVYVAKKISKRETI